MKKTILIAALSCLFAGFAYAEDSSEVVMAEKTYISIGAGVQFTNPQFSLIDAGGQLEFGWWFTPYTAVGLNARAALVRTSNPDGDVIFLGKNADASARLMGFLDLTNLYLGAEEGTRNPFHIMGYAGLGMIINSRSINPHYWMPSVGLDFVGRVDNRTRIFVRAGLNLYHPLSGLTIYPEASLGLRFGLGKGKTYPKDPNQGYKDDIAELEKALVAAKNDVRVQKDTVVVTETKEVEVEKLVRDTVTLKVNQVDTLTIYDVVEVGGGLVAKTDTVFVGDTVFVKADTVYIKSLPEVLVKTVYVDSISAGAVDSAYFQPVVKVDTIYVVSEPQILVQTQTDTVFVQSEPEVQVQVQKDTVFVPSEPEIMVRTVYVNKEPIVVKDTVFVATDPEVQIQTVYRDKEPVILVDTVYVQSEPEIEVRTVYRDREVVKVQKDTVLIQSEPEVQIQVLKDTVFVQSEPEVQIQVQVQKDTVFVPSEPEIRVKTVYVNKEPVIVKDTVFVASDPEVQIQTVYRDKEPVIVKDTVYVQSEPEIEIRYRDREVVKVQKDTIYIAGETQVDTVVIEKPVEVKIDTVFVPAAPEIQIQVQKDTVVVEKDPVVQVDTVVVEKDPVVLVDTVLVPVPVPVEPESSLIYVVFPENAAWVNYGARKQLDRIAQEIKDYDGDSRYVMIAPVSPDSEDTVKAYNLGVRRVSQVRLHLIRENGVDSRKLRESVIISPAGIAAEDGNAFVIVAREDDPRLAEILEQ
ncbi:MAG: hypothetical protein J5740_06745 [Bacteroidales bacterium]|nr:hypothetical protein [Bacteroidales bacterium]